VPRLRGWGEVMSRIGGSRGGGAAGPSLGTRGPGETKLEVDRRRILSRIAKLERELAEVAKNRTTQRKARRRAEHPQVALVGYTNAGKSTLLNHLTGAGVLVEDRLFSTLDSTVRRLSLPGGETVLVSDTVGFVRKLPHQLVESFRSTLEEVGDADLVLHVVDASAADPERQIEAVRAVLAEIGAGEIPELRVVNKVDVADPERVTELVAGNGAVAISAVTGEGTDKLLETLGARLRALNAVVELVVPYDRGDVIAALHREGEVLVEAHEDEATRVRARLDPVAAARFRDFAVGEGETA
jgi:GTP-binding protein HflX